MDRVFRIPVDLRRLQLVVVHVVDADVIFVQIIWVFLHDWNQILPNDRDRHRPVRIEIDFDDLAVDVGRRARRPTHHRRVARHRDIVLDRFDARSREIDDYITRTQVGGERLEPRNVDLELIATRLGRDVHRHQRHLAHDAVDGQPVASLEPPHRRLDIGIVDVVADRVGIEIARHRKPLAQIDDAWVPHAEMQFVDLRHQRPAAARDDAVVSRHGLLGKVRRLRRQCRRGRLGHVDGARGLIESLAEALGLTVAIVHQRIEGRVGGCPARHRARGGESRRAGRAAQEGAPIRISPEPTILVIHGNVIRSIRPPKAAGL